jgi:hypothetical protein
LPHGPPIPVGVLLAPSFFRHTPLDTRDQASDLFLVPFVLPRNGPKTANKRKQGNVKIKSYYSEPNKSGFRDWEP